MNELTIATIFMFSGCALAAIVFIIVMVMDHQLIKAQLKYYSEVNKMTNKDEVIIDGVRYIKAEEDLSFAKEIKKHPERFETYTGNKWKTINKNDGVSRRGTTKILNSEWNYTSLNGEVFFVEFIEYGKSTKEIIRRKY